MLIQEDLNLLLNSYLTSFGIVNQFIELKFSNDTYEEITFFVDCDLSTNDAELERKKEYFDKLDNDVSSIIYFIKANRKKVEAVEFDKNLKLVFTNNYIIEFSLFSEYEEPLSITFQKNGVIEKSFTIPSYR